MNKQQIIKILSNLVRAAGHIAEESEGDADTDIAAKLLSLAQPDNNDVLILLYTGIQTCLMFPSEIKGVSR